MSRRVPWASWEEWHTVRGWLFSPAAADVQKGLDRVRIRAPPVHTVIPAAKREALWCVSYLVHLHYCT